MLPDHLSYVMINVTDMDRSVQFYRDVLGIPLRFQSPGWSEFNTPGTTIALHIAGGAAVERKGPTAGSVDIGWTVPDINAVCAELRTKGVTIAMEPTRSEGDSLILAIFLDPDGCPLSLAQIVRG